jgi:hypothetical protein
MQSALDSGGRPHAQVPGRLSASPSGCYSGVAHVGTALGVPPELPDQHCHQPPEVTALGFLRSSEN